MSEKHPSNTYSPALTGVPLGVKAVPTISLDLTNSMLEQSPIVILDAQGKVCHASAAFRGLVKRSAADIQLANCQSFLSRESQIQFSQAILSVLETKEKWTGTLELSVSADEKRWVVVQISPYSELGLQYFCVQFIDYISKGEFKVPGGGADLSANDLIAADLSEATRSFADAIWSNFPGVVCQLNDQGRLVRWNERFERLSGYSAVELNGMQVFELFTEDMRGEIAARLREVLEFGHCEQELYLRAKNGDLRPYVFTGIRHQYLNERGIIAFGADISHRKQIEEALREKSALFEAQVESSLSGILVTDCRGERIIQNERLNEMWNIPPAIATPTDLKPQLYYVASQTKNPAEFLGRVKWLTSHPEVTASDEIELVDGRVFDRYTGPVFGKDSRYYGRYWTHRDITSRKEAERRIRYLATYDSMTSLPNRNSIQEKITHRICKSVDDMSQFAIMFIDLDRFKVINDGYGNAFGDAVLKATAQKLSMLVDEEDVIARYGGDEFLILINNFRSIDDVQEIANAIVSSMDTPMAIQNRQVYVSVSVGVSVYPQDGDTFESLISNANLAMYRAKELGSNNSQFFTSEMSEAVLEKISVETRLRSAAKEGHLSLVYQPKVSLENGCITGCEALMRWTDPELGPVSPAHFIPIAEESGLILQLGDWALRTACLQAKEWLKDGLPSICVAVNVSARQFLHQSMYDWVMATLRETELPPECLEIELTESLLAQDVEKALIDVQRLRDEGVKFSIDDFGTGYSSLSYLNRFCVDTLKIDQSFVRRMLTKKDDANIVRAIISLAHSLGFRAIAEGVETEAHCHLLKLHGCEEIQGYYFSRPIPAEEFQAMVRENRQLSFSSEQASHI